MRSEATTVKEYFEGLPEDRKAAMIKLRSVIKKNLPKGFEERIYCGMPNYVVPHSLYPKGYHCDPKMPLSLLGFASQKNFIAIYHMGIYANKKLRDWFTAEYAKQAKGKLDMDKCCIRFKNPDNIPFALIGELSAKMTPQDWIDCYEKNMEGTRKKVK